MCSWYCYMLSFNAMNELRINEAPDSYINTFSIYSKDKIVDNQKSVLYSFGILKYNGRWRRVWRYQRGNQNLYIKEDQTTQWPKEKVQKDKQRSTKHTHKTKDRVTRTPLKAGVNAGAPEGFTVPASLVAPVKRPVLYCIATSTQIL